MFTGLVEEVARIESIEPTPAGARLRVAAREVTTDLKLGDSIAVNGCCLTVTNTESPLSFDVIGETLARTNIGELTPGALVNLERALPANGRLGGHFVQGHIDATSRVLAFSEEGTDRRLEIALPAEFAHYVVFKGSIAVNGISLTVAEVSDDRFALCIIPHTLEATNLQGLNPGDSVNLEFDLLAKYMERLLRK